MSLLALKMYPNLMEQHQPLKMFLLISQLEKLLVSLGQTAQEKQP